MVYFHKLSVFSINSQFFTDLLYSWCLICATFSLKEHLVLSGLVFIKVVQCCWDKDGIPLDLNSTVFHSLQSILLLCQCQRYYHSKCNIILTFPFKTSNQTNKKNPSTNPKFSNFNTKMCVLVISYSHVCHVSPARQHSAGIPNFPPVLIKEFAPWKHHKEK